jgi:hypothetical protein
LGQAIHGSDGLSVVPWSTRFDDPISLPDGGELRTLHEREEWQTVMEVLLSAVAGREPVRLVQVALTLALQESKR